MGGSTAGVSQSASVRGSVKAGGNSGGNTKKTETVKKL